MEFVHEMGDLGFFDPDPEIVRPLVGNRALVDSDGTAMWIKSSEVRRILARLFKETPLC